LTKSNLSDDEDFDGICLDDIKKIKNNLENKNLEIIALS